MVFFCQRNCYASKYSATVTSCIPSEVIDETNGKKKIDCYEVTFDDTVFFPEGGGQPYDRGVVDNVQVIKVLRKGGEAVHYLLEPVKVGTEVTQVIDWERRYDHMQQHSAQHLITAIADRDYHCATLSWNLGEKISSIELDTQKLTEDEISQLERCVNDAVRNRLSVLIEEFDLSDPKLMEARSRGLPEDVVGPVRLVTIEGIDTNMCCGTHVSNLSDLQAIKLLYCEKGKVGKTLLFFVAGIRVLRYLSDCISRERELNLALHSNPSDHLRLVEKCKKDLKHWEAILDLSSDHLPVIIRHTHFSNPSSNPTKELSLITKATKSLSDAFRDLAAAEAFKFTHLSPRPSVFFHHRRDGNMDYLGALVSEISDDTVLKVLTVGEESGPGALLIHGNPDDVNAVAKGVCDILEGKGGGRSRFTAKIQRPSKRKEAEKFVKEKLSHLTCHYGEINGCK